MAQWDLLLTQNVAVGVDYSEKFVNIDKGGLLSADASQTPVVLAPGTDGYILARDDAETTGLKWIVAPGTAYTFSNGLTETAGTVEWGGSVTDTIVLENSGTNNLTFSYHDAGYNVYNDVTINRYRFAVDAYDDTNSYSGSLFVGSVTGTHGKITLVTRSSSDEMIISLHTTDGIIVTDNINTKGMEYAADYSIAGKLITDGLWIPDWASVTGYAVPLTLPASTTIEASTYSLNIDGDNGTSASTRITVNPSSLLLTTFDQSGHSISSGYTQLLIGATSTSMVADDGANLRSIEVTTSSMSITDTINSKGLQYIADFSTNGKAISNGRWIPDWAAVTGYVDDLKTGDYRIKRAQLQHSDDGSTLTIITLPAGAVVWDIQVQVTTTFDATTPVLDVGNSAHTVGYYISGDTTALGSTGWKSFSLTNIPDAMSGSENIQMRYQDQSTDGSVGSAYIYVFYSEH